MWLVRQCHKCVGLLLCACTPHTANCIGVETNVLVDSRVPLHCSSPGWEETPYDISTVLSSYVHFNCRSSMDYTEMIWLYEGREDIMTTQLASKVTLYNGNSSLRYGPIDSDDDGTAIGCEVSTDYGRLPSSLGRISVKCEL